MTKNFPDTIVLLVGGKGTRLGEMTRSTPKPLLEFLGKPFLAWQCEILAEKGIRNFVFATGYLADQFRDFEEKFLPAGCTLTLVEEKELLGTGGAFCHVLEEVSDLSDIFWAGNGDSFWNVNLMEKMWALHWSGAEMTFLSVVAEQQKGGASGGVTFDEDGLVDGWGVVGSGFLNGGLYLFEKKFFEEAPKNQAFSLENDYMGKKVDEGKVKSVLDEEGQFLDFGTPYFYDQVEEFLKKNFQGIL